LTNAFWMRSKNANPEAGLISIDASALKAMIKGETSLKAVSKYWD
jgi:hypothetical protein